MSLLKKINVINDVQNDWGTYFDKIYVLTIPENATDHVRRELRFLPKYSIYVFRPDKTTINDGDTDNSLYDILRHTKCNSTCENIMNNHLAIIREAYTEGLQKIVIMEDDVECNAVKSPRYMFDWLRTHSWDVFFLGYCQWPYLLSYRVHDQILKLTSPMGTFAYALSRAGMKIILDFADIHAAEAKHIDKLIGYVIPLRKYGLYPSMCFQSDGPALFKKALTKLPLNLNVRFADVSNLLQEISLYTPIVGSVCNLLLCLLLLYLYVQRYVKRSAF